MISKTVIEALQRNRDKRLRGEHIAIPWSFSKLSTVIPGVERSKYYLVSAGPKAGKSQLTDFLFVLEPVEWYLRTLPKIRLKVLYFSLEMSRESKLLQAISYKLNKSYNICISPQYLRSTFAGYILEDNILQIINSHDFQLWLKNFETLVTYIDDLRSPNAIYNFVKHYAEKHGDYVKKNDNIIDYIPHDTEEHVIIVTDHLSLLSPDNGDTLHMAMYKYSSHHCLEFRDRFKYTVVNVQQQSADSSKQQFDFRGNSVIDKIRPSAEGLADMKLSARDVNLMLSLFNPFAYNMDEYESIDLRRIGRWHRELFINLNRDGMSNVQIQLYFNGAINDFMELPRPMDETTYKYVQAQVNKLIH